MVSVVQNCLISYNEYLTTQPLLTKACTSAVTTGLGDYLGQVISKRPSIDLRSVARYALFGLMIIGPLAHNFYYTLDVLVPPGESGAAIKRLLVERFTLPPLLMLLHFYLMAIMEGRGDSVARSEVRHKMWPALKMNWKVWTPIQFVNVNYVPQQYRPLVANVVAVFWVMYLSNKMRQVMKKE